MNAQEPYMGDQLNQTGQIMGPIFFTDEEFSELIMLIDDDPVDEELLRGIRKKLAVKRRRLRQRTREEDQ